MAVLAGEWGEHGTENELFIEPSANKVEIWVSDEYRTTIGIGLTPDQARSVAAKLLEIANDLDTNK